MIWLLGGALAATIEVGPGDDVWTAAAALAPGDELVLEEGTYSTYSGSSWYRELVLTGEEGAPIVIRAAEGAEVIIEGDPAGSQNVLNLQGSWWELRGLHFRYGSHGLRLGESDHGSVIDVEISETADVALSMNREGATYDQMIVRGCHIYDTSGTGEGMYLGCNEGACVVSNSFIEHNHVHDTADSEQGDGIELKAGSYGNVIRHNVVHDTYYPGLTLYGTYGEAPNEVYGNVVWSTGDNGIQVVGEVSVHDNLVFQAGAYGIYAKSSQGSDPESLHILHNTVADGGEGCLRINDLDLGGADVVAANNLLSCEAGYAIRLGSGEGSATFSANAVLGESMVDGQVELSADILSGELVGWPEDGGAIDGEGDDAWRTEEDFDCLPRGQSDIGAYNYFVGGDPLWDVAAEFKESCAEDIAEGSGGGDTGGEETGEPETGGEETGAVETGGEETGPEETGSLDSGSPDSGAPDTADDVTGGAGGEGCGCGGGDKGAAAGLLLGLGLLRRRARRAMFRG